MARIDVISQVEGNYPGPDGTFQPGVKVTATINGGPTTFSVVVPVAGYSADKVTEALRAEYQKRGPVEGLGFEA